MHSRNSGKNTKKRLSHWRGSHMGGGSALEEDGQ